MTIRESRAQIRSTGPDLSVLDGYSAASLQKIVFDPVRWIVKDVVPEGLTLLGGRPKQGNGWLCLDIALGVASDRLALGRIDTGLPRDVPYVALEDNPRRLHAKHDGRAVTQNARTAFLARFEERVDPTLRLPREERMLRAEHARKAYFTTLALRSAVARGRRRGGDKQTVSGGIRRSARTQR